MLAYTKAFYLIQHDIILEKLEYLSVHPVIVQGESKVTHQIQTNITIPKFGILLTKFGTMIEKLPHVRMIIILFVLR